MEPRAGPSTAAPPAVASLTPAPTAPAPPASPDYSPTMTWILSGPAAPMLGEEDDIEAALAPPPPPLYCPVHGFGPCPARDGTAPPLPSPTPPAPAVDSTSHTVDDEPPVTDPAPPADDGAALDGVHPEARRLLRTFAAAMAAHRFGPAASSWNPAALGLSSSNEGGGPSSF
ncbi:vegetative cell wall protein gp1-like [Brachypodium distachyon]|uniref:vegetative cell wall protein gp1-like n=1 Tax=Brachypodium distachyon TaxID=15368 RepID=UPI00052FE1AE|nr:vegetative cell wall protein gp1-like [Brachypodium distachyon]|eukprot:XP_010230293.1 vegetative cell wall protein gp1-like [Brachypodium distachyon]